MSPRIFTPQSLRGANIAFKRFNSSTSGGRRVIVLPAAQPSARASAVPFMWLLCGGAATHAFSRVEGTSEQNRDLEKLLIV